MRAKEIYGDTQMLSAFSFVIEYYVPCQENFEIKIVNAATVIRLRTGQSCHVLVSMLGDGFGSVIDAVKNASVVADGISFVGWELGPSLVGGIMEVDPSCKATNYIDLGAEYPDLFGNR